MSGYEFDDSEPIFVEPDGERIINYLDEKPRLKLADENLPTFPLTRNEAQLIYDELRNHWFSRDHVHYHYSDGLMSRLRQFVYGDKPK